MILRMEWNGMGGETLPIRYFANKQSRPEGAPITRIIFLQITVTCCPFFNATAVAFSEFSISIRAGMNWLSVCKPMIIESVKSLSMD